MFFRNLINWILGFMLLNLDFKHKFNFVAPGSSLPRRRSYGFVTQSFLTSLVINLSIGFGIRSCLATSHKQILKTPFNMTSSCILGFQQERMS